MNNQSIRLSAAHAGRLMMYLVIMLPALAAAQPADLAEATKRYQTERAACLELAIEANRKDCLREAGAALQAARSGDLLVATPAEYERNLLARCDFHPAAEQLLCVRMLKGEGTQSGSVEGGGILRELTVTYVGGVESKTGTGR